MNEEHINKIKQILSDWNPLGDKANQITDVKKKIKHERITKAYLMLVSEVN